MAGREKEGEQSRACTARLRSISASRRDGGRWAPSKQPLRRRCCPPGWAAAAARALVAPAWEESRLATNRRSKDRAQRRRGIRSHLLYSRTTQANLRCDRNRSHVETKPTKIAAAREDLGKASGAAVAAAPRPPCCDAPRRDWGEAEDLEDGQPRSSRVLVLAAVLWWRLRSVLCLLSF